MYINMSHIYQGFFMGIENKQQNTVSSGRINSQAGRMLLLTFSTAVYRMF